MTQQAFGDRLKGHGKKRIVLSDIRRYFFETHPELASHPARSQALLAALHALAETGEIQLPASGSWERIGNPPLPIFVIVAARRTSPKIDYTKVAWVPELSFWVKLNNPQLEVAKAINDFLLRRQGSLIPVPLNERSMEIFGNEKKLQNLVTGDTLFAGRLRIEVIAAFHVSTPLPYRIANAPGKPLLVIENHHSYWSFGEWNLRSRRYAAVVYGSGHEFAKSGLGLDSVMRETSASGTEYFGDFDVNGLAVPATFSAKKILHDGTKLCAAGQFYAWLLEHGTRQMHDDTNKPLRITLGVNWLPQHLQAAARALLEGGRRIAQESLGYETLIREF